jgi:hypothetical protein
MEKAQHFRLLFQKARSLFFLLAAQSKRIYLPILDTKKSGIYDFNFFIN